MTNLENLSGNYEFEFPDLRAANGMHLRIKEYLIPLKNGTKNCSLHYVFPDGATKKISTIFKTKPPTAAMDPDIVVQSFDYLGYNYWLVFHFRKIPIMVEIFQLGLKIPKDKLTQPNFNAK